MLFSDLNMETESDGLKQQSMEECMTPMWSADDIRTTTINFKIGEMLAVDNQPISFVDDEVTKFKLVV